MEKPTHPTRLHPDAWEEVIREHPEVTHQLSDLLTTDTDSMVGLVGIYTLLHVRARLLLADWLGHADEDDAPPPQENTTPSAT